MSPADHPLQPVDTWERILARMADARQAPTPAIQIGILMELVVRLRLLGQEEGIADRRHRAPSSGGRASIGAHPRCHESVGEVQLRV